MAEGGKGKPDDDNTDETTDETTKLKSLPDEMKELIDYCTEIIEMIRVPLKEGSLCTQTVKDFFAYIISTRTPEILSTELKPEIDKKVIKILDNFYSNILNLFSHLGKLSTPESIGNFYAMLAIIPLVYMSKGRAHLPVRYAEHWLKYSNSFPTRAEVEAKLKQLPIKYKGSPGWTGSPTRVHFGDLPTLPFCEKRHAIAQAKITEKSRGVIHAMDQAKQSNSISHVFPMRSYDYYDDI